MLHSVKKYFKKLRAQLDKNMFRPYVKKKNVEGVKFDFYIGDIEGKSWYDLNSTDPDWPEMKFLKDNLVRKGDVILECGGHHGCTMIVLASWAGEKGKIITFEPSPSNAEIIRKNLEINNLPNAELQAKAVGSKPGKIRMNKNSNASVSLNGTNENSVEVDIIKLDDFKNHSPNFLKIDVEGFEVEVLRGATEILKTKPKLAIEIHPEQLERYGEKPETVFTFFNLDDYKSWMQWSDESAPEPYTPGKPITERCHFFAVPK